MSIVPGKLRPPSLTSRVVPGLVLLFAFAHFAHHLVTALPVPLLPFIRDEFSLDYTRAALVISAFSVPYGFSQLPAGWLADRFGARRLLLVGISGVATMGLVVGLSTSYTVLLIALFVMGALGGGYHPAAPAVIAQVTDSARRGRALGFHMIGGSASYFLAPIVAGALAVAWGWRSPFITLAIPSLLFGVLLYIVLGRREKAATPVSTVAGKPEAECDRIDWLRMATLLVLTGTTAAIIQCVVAFIPLYLVDAYGYEEHNAAFAISLFYSTGLWAAVAGGHLSDRIGRVRVVVLFGLLSGPALALLHLSGSAIMVLGLMFFLGIALYARAPASESYVVANTPIAKRSSVLGIYYFGSQEGAGVLAPLFGRLVDWHGFGTAFTAVGLGLLTVAILCSVILLRGSGAD